jgi:phosphomannomutase
MPQATTSCKHQAMTRFHPETLVLFDVDGTLTASRKCITAEMQQVLEQLKQITYIGFVGGSDLAKQQEQLGPECTQFFDFAFSENGATAYKNGQLLSQESFIGYLGEEKYSKLANYLLRYIADLDIPKKRGTFIEFRNAMINVSPIGRNCTYKERCEFEAYDKQHEIRRKMCSDLEAAFPEYCLKYSIGGQISIDIFPQGWDKTFCLKHLQQEPFKEIHFFGDKIVEGGNDWEIANHPRIIAHPVTNPENTARILKELFIGKSNK